MAKQWKSGKKKEDKLKGERCVRSGVRACMWTCGSERVDTLGGGFGGCCGNGGKLTLTLNNGIKEADI